MAFLGKPVCDYRRSLIRELMRTQGLDALAFLDGDFFQFATNFHTDVRTWERPIVVVVPADGAPFAVMNELSTHHVAMARERGTLWLEEVVFYAEHARLADRLPLVGQWPEVVADSLRRHGLGRARIGFDAGAGLLKHVTEIVPEVAFVPMLAAMRELRWVKHTDEIALMRDAASLSDWVQDRYREAIRPGRLVQEMDAAMATLMIEEASRRFPGENLEVMRCWTLSGPPSASPHGDGAPTGQRIETGHGLVNIVIPRLNGVVIENERTWFCGRPTAEQARLFETARAANEAAIGAAVTGNPVSAIDAAAQAVIEKAGLGALIRNRTGHGMGTVGHEFPEDMAFNHRALRNGEVYSAEPGIYVYGLGGFRMDDSVVVASTPEVLTKTAKDIKSQTVL